MRELARKPRPGRRNPAPIPLRMPKPPTDGPAGRYYGGIARGLITDLGGRGHVPTALREMVSNFAGVCTLLREQNYKIAAGKHDEVVVADYAVLINCLVKLGSRIGLCRIPKEIPSLELYLSDLKRRSDEEPEDAKIEFDAEVVNAEDDDASMPDSADGD